jgi:hypothetical protein
MAQVLHLQEAGKVSGLGDELSQQAGAGQRVQTSVLLDFLPGSGRFPRGRSPTERPDDHVAFEYLTHPAVGKLDLIESSGRLNNSSSGVVARRPGPEWPLFDPVVTGLEIGDAIDPGAVGTVLASPAGGLKGVPEEASVTLLVNQADTEALAETARAVLDAAFAAADRPVRGVVSSFRSGRCTVVDPDA